MLVRPRFDLYLPFPLPRHACKNCLMWTQRLIKKFQVIQNSTPLSPLIQLTETVYQICTQCKWRHLVVKCKWCHLTMAMKMECEQGRISWDGPYIKLPLPNSPYHCIIFGVRTIMLHTLRVEAGLGGLSVLWAWVTWKDVDSRLWSARWGGGAGPGSCTTSDVREILRPGRVRIRCWSDSAHYLSSNYTLSSLQDTYRPEAAQQNMQHSSPLLLHYLLFWQTYHCWCWTKDQKEPNILSSCHQAKPNLANIKTGTSRDMDNSEISCI